MMAGSEMYLVKPGDTLGKIAARSGASVQDLTRWNGLKDPNHIRVGQTLYLSERSAFGVSVLFLDALRSPIENLRYEIRYDGRSHIGTTPPNGRVPTVVTKDAKSQIEVLTQDLQGNWRSLCRTASEYGHKLLTIVSGSVVVKGETEMHPQAASTKPVLTAHPSPPPPGGKQAPPPPKVSGQPSKNNPAVKTKTVKAKQGQPVIQIAVDIPQGVLDLFANYRGGEITNLDWRGGAERIECEPEVLKAIAEVESEGRPAFWRLNSDEGAHIPVILYERHYFSDLTGHKYDKDHPDISWAYGYRKKSRLGKSDEKMSDGRVDADDIYESYASSYLRFINAYHLDPVAALQSCSWGKFQIMGRNYVLCGLATPNIFVSQICTSEKSQIGLLVEYIRGMPRKWKDRKNHDLGKEISLHEAVKTKNWAAIAFNYNGPEYFTNQYDSRLKAAYEKLKKSA